MSLKVETVIMLGCVIPEDLIKPLCDNDYFHADLDSYSNWKRGHITYIYDGMNGEYLYIGEVLAYTEDTYSDFHCTIDTDIYENNQMIRDFIKRKFGIYLEPKIHVFNHIQ